MKPIKGDNSRLRLEYAGNLGYDGYTLYQDPDCLITGRWDNDHWGDNGATIKFVLKEAVDDNNAAEKYLIQLVSS
jgi:hypothetical protein